MFAIGLTGGIGTGKSAVADLLVGRGATLIDADAIAATVRAPGGSAFAPLVERFGDGILAPDGTIDGPALAKVAFAEEASVADLNRITHPAIGEEMRRQLEAVADRDGVVVLDIPLLPARRTARGSACAPWSSSTARPRSPWNAWWRSGTWTAGTRRRGWPRS